MRPSRQALSGEIVLSLFAAAYAMSAIVVESPLHHILMQREGLVGVMTWFMVMGAPALWLAIVGFVEWCSPSERCSSTLRGWLLVAQGTSWVYGLHLMAVMHRPFSLLTLHALIGCIACAWFHIENRRVQREFRQQIAVASSGAR